VNGKCVLSSTLETVIPETENPLVSPSVIERVDKSNEVEDASEEGRLFIVFLITCIVFVILLIVTGFLLFYVNRLTRGRGNRENRERENREQSTIPENRQETIPKRVQSERRIMSETQV
jgi:flagellar biogenesis protein FliO